MLSPSWWCTLTSCQGASGSPLPDRWGPGPRGCTGCRRSAGATRRRRRSGSGSRTRRASTSTAGGLPRRGARVWCSGSMSRGRAARADPRAQLLEARNGQVEGVVDARCLERVSGSFADLGVDGRGADEAVHGHGRWSHSVEVSRSGSRVPDGYEGLRRLHLGPGPHGGVEFTLAARVWVHQRRPIAKGHRRRLRTRPSRNGPRPSRPERRPRPRCLGSVRETAGVTMIGEEALIPAASPPHASAGTAAEACRTPS